MPIYGRVLAVRTSCQQTFASQLQVKSLLLSLATYPTMSEPARLGIDFNRSRIFLACIFFAFLKSLDSFSFLLFSPSAAHPVLLKRRKGRSEEHTSELQ